MRPSPPAGASLCACPPACTCTSRRIRMMQGRGQTCFAAAASEAPFFYKRHCEPGAPGQTSSSARRPNQPLPLPPLCFFALRRTWPAPGHKHRMWAVWAAARGERGLQSNGAWGVRRWAPAREACAWDGLADSACAGGGQMAASHCRTRQRRSLPPLTTCSARCSRNPTAAWRARR